MLPIVLLLWLLQSANSDDVFTEKERMRYAQQTDPDGRMRFYSDVIERYRKDFQGYSRRDEFDAFTKALGNYGEFLRIVDTDIQQIPEDKRRKSRALRRLEIDLRKSREDLQDFKRLVTLGQQDSFNQRIEQSESIRSRILQFIFGRGLLREK